MEVRTLGSLCGFSVGSAGVLAAVAGAAACSAASSSEPGRLKVSGNARYLVTEDGRPFFWMGDTAWWIRNITPEDVDYYLAHRARHGFSVIQMHPGYSVQDYAGHRPFVDDDTDKPNEAFWRNMDEVVTKAGEHGLHVALVPMWGGEYRKAFGTDAEKAFRFGQWIGRRYAACRHVLWIVSGEYDVINRLHVPIPEALKSVLVAAARGLRDAHGGSQLMTIHPGISFTSSLEFHGEPWLDFNMLQSAHMVDSTAYGILENYALIAHDYALEPTKPVVDGEPFYEDTPDGVWFCRDSSRPRGGADVVRRKAYWAVFAGAFGHTYGHSDIYGFYQPAHPGDILEYPHGPGNRGHWKDALDAPGALQMKHLRALMESRPFLDRIPDASLVVGGLRHGTDHVTPTQAPDGGYAHLPLAPDAVRVVAGQGEGLDHVAATRAVDGGYAMLYLPSRKPVTVDLSKLSGARVKARWFDPRTGEAEPAGELEPRGTREFTPPNRGEGGDWVLVLDDAARGFPAPGTEG